MTETEWLASQDPTLMLEYLGGDASDRKARLFACACFQRLSHLLTDPRWRASLEVADRFADGAASEEELSKASNEACRAWDDSPRKDELAELIAYGSASVVTTPHHHDRNLPYLGATLAAIDTSIEAVAIVHLHSGGDLESEDAPTSAVAIQERRAQANLLRDIFGYPQRQAAANLRWQTEKILVLAQAIYADRAFDRLPILADALEDAGCDNRDILDHCRHPGEHVRGCWVVDLVLGKE